MILSPDVYVAETAQTGRGVFAARDFKKCDIIENAPVVVLGFPQIEKMPKELCTRVFSWHTFGSLYALALGYGSLYNHDNPANLVYTCDKELKIIRFVAARDISANEELTINYNAKLGGNVSDKDSWFETHDIKPV